MAGLVLAIHVLFAARKTRTRGSSLRMTEIDMSPWLPAALDYIPRWLEFQMQSSQQPGCMIAVAHNGKIVLERAFGSANLKTGEELTPRHRFRVASHSKTFTAAGIMLLREQGKLKLDDGAGQFVKGLHPAVARATIAQLLSHTAGLVRDGDDAGQFLDRRPYRSAEELRADFRKPPVIEPNARMKYSNHGYGLLGMIIEQITGEPYARWITRTVISPAGLTETTPDTPIKRGTPFARGHTGRILTGQRHVIPGDNPTNGLIAAAGFVSTAADIARYFSQLSPNARMSFLSVASRREMSRRHWRNPHTTPEQHYGLGTISGTLNGWDWFGHSGGFQGYISRTCVYPAQGITVSVLTNAVDGWAHPWVDGIAHIMQAFARNGAPERKVRDWNGRFWTLWGAVDLVPMGDKVLTAVPGFINPMMDAGELEITGHTTGRIAMAPGFSSHGEPVSCKRTKSGKIVELRLAGSRLYPAAKVAREIETRYGTAPKARTKRRQPTPK
jgi:CubicO group peptidase (beta-lactamase class C family)